jgi:hypothetical protein
MSFIICTLHQILSEIKSRRLRWAGHGAFTGEMKYAYTFLVGEPERMISHERRGRYGSIK